MLVRQKSNICHEGLRSWNVAGAGLTATVSGSRKSKSTNSPLWTRSRRARIGQSGSPAVGAACAYGGRHCTGLPVGSGLLAASGDTDPSRARRSWVALVTAVDNSRCYFQQKIKVHELASLDTNYDRQARACCCSGGAAWRPSLRSQ